MPDSWWLEDAEARKREAPYTFYKPSPGVVERLAPGDRVKLIFAFDAAGRNVPAAERMWVEVAGVDGGRFTGLLRSEPVHIRGLAAGDPVLFEARHIADTSHDEDDGLDRFFMRCYVTGRVLWDGVPVGYLYREDPDTEEDSGWRLMAGDEDDAYMDDPANLAFVALGTLLNQDDSFLPLLDAPAGSAFVRDPATGRFAADLLV